MQTSKYHTRVGYELMAMRLMKQYWEVAEVRPIPDIDLLLLINRYLILFGCVPFTSEELAMTLS